MSNLPAPISPNLPSDPEKARELMAAYTREVELNQEAIAPSGDDHLIKVINSPIKSAIMALDKDNERLQDRIENGGIFEDDGVTPQMARELLQSNIKSLVDLRNSLVKSKGDSSGSSIEINFGSVFSEALQGAREAKIDAEVVGG